MVISIRSQFFFILFIFKSLNIYPCSLICCAELWFSAISNWTWLKQIHCISYISYFPSLLYSLLFLQSRFSIFYVIPTFFLPQSISIMKWYIKALYIQNVTVNHPFACTTFFSLTTHCHLLGLLISQAIFHSLIKAAVYSF